MLSDFKYAFRRLAKSPGFTVVVMLILALGIGANTAIFTLVEGMLLRGLPVRKPDELIFIAAHRTAGAEGQASETLSYPAYERLRDESHSLNGIVISGRAARLLAADPSAENAISVQASHVSGNFFSMLGVAASSGRTLNPEDDRKNAPHTVAVLSHSFWQRQFGGSPEVLGRTVLLDHMPFVVVGIAAPGFYGVEFGRSVDLWVPIQTLPLLDSGADRQLQAAGFNNFLVLGRLRDGVRVGTAHAELDALFQAEGIDLFSSAADRSKNWGQIVVFSGGSGRLDHREEVRQSLTTAMAVTLLVLIVACANVASMLLARTAARQRELAVRAALGAGRARLLRQLMMESALLASAAGCAGLIFASWGLSMLSKLWFGPYASLMNLDVDRPVLALTLAASVVTGILVGLVPALRFSQLDLVSGLKNQANTSTSGSRQRLNRGLVAAQIAVSVCLLAGAGLFVRSLQSLQEVNLGFPREGLMMATIGFDNYDASRQLTLAQDLSAGIESLPGVRAAGVVTGGLWDGSHYSSRIGVEGYTPRADENMYAYFTQVGPNFFEKMGIPLLRGRGLREADVFPVRGSTPATLRTVVINESMARRFFGEADPVGRHLNVFLGKAEIVGVARNSKYVNLRDDNSLQYFVPYAPGPKGMRLSLAIRTMGDPRALASSLAAAIQRVDPGARVLGVNSMEDAINSHYVTQERAIAQVAGYSGGFALGLACLGLYGLLAYNVAQRTREIGVRIALGARATDIIALIVKQAAGLAILGCAAGLAGAVALVHFVASRLYGVSGADPLTFAGTAGLLMTVALFSCWLPARRAARIDPIIALRAE